MHIEGQDDDATGATADRSGDMDPTVAACLAFISTECSDGDVRGKSPSRPATTEARPKLVAETPSPAADVAARVRQILASARTEEDLRLNFELLLRAVLPELQSTYERTVKTTTFQGRT